MTRLKPRSLSFAGVALVALIAGVGQAQACWLFGHGSTTAAYPPAPVYAAAYAPAPTYAYYAPAPVQACYAPQPVQACYNPCSACSSCPTQSCGYAPQATYYQPATVLRPTGCCGSSAQTSYYYPQSSYYAPSYSYASYASSACNSCGSTSCSGCDSCSGGSYASAASNSCSNCAPSSSGTTITGPSTYSNSTNQPTPAAERTYAPGPDTRSQRTDRPATEENRSGGPMIQVPMANPAEANPMPGNKTSTQPGLFTPRNQDRTASMPVIKSWNGNTSQVRTVSGYRPAQPSQYVEDINLND